jgi:hypothetical protein
MKNLSNSIRASAYETFDFDTTVINKINETDVEQQMGNLPDPLNRRAAPRPQTLRCHFTDHACMAGGISSSAFRSSRRRFTFSRQFFLASSSNFCSKIKKAAFSRAAVSRWSSFSSSG